MKKALSLILALVLCLSLCACGGDKANKTPNATTATPTSETETFEVGTTVRTEVAEFTLTEVNDGVRSALQVLFVAGDIGQEYLSEDITLADLPEDIIALLRNKQLTYSLMMLTFTIKNIGKDTLNDFVSFPDQGGQTRVLDDLVRINYNDGYIFKAGDRIGAGYLDMEPLSPATEYDVTINVPEEVLLNTDAPLLVEVALPDGNGNTTIFTYKIR